MISQREFAKQIGVSHTAVQKAVRTKRIPAGKNGQIDPEKARKAWDANTTPDSRSRPAAAADPRISKTRVAFSVSRAMREQYVAKLAKLEFKEKSGKLVNRESIAREYSNMVSAARTRLLGIPSKLAPVLAIETDPVICEALIETEILQALEELGRYEPSTEPTAAAA